MSFHQNVPNNYVTQVEIRITALEDKVYTLEKTLQDLLEKVNVIEAKVNNNT
jgi:predicted  nucleic acid-binding Zn-ribbon protein